MSVPGTPSGLAELVRYPTANDADLCGILKQATLEAYVVRVPISVLSLVCLAFLHSCSVAQKADFRTPVTRRSQTWSLHFCGTLAARRLGSVAETLVDPHLGTTSGLIHEAGLLSLSLILVVTAAPIMPPSNLLIPGRFVKVKTTPIRRGCAEFYLMAVLSQTPLHYCEAIDLFTPARPRMRADGDVQFN